jgi:hypothetical protein
MACAAKDENDIFCGCGQGQLSLDFIEDVPMWSSVVDFTARAAKPRSFRSLWSILHLMAGAKTNHPLREAVLPAGI